ncbi:MAG: GntR family transcriptional regulator [Clostridiales bacterium]|nr:GntR family transcriptional regulator [Clostridiales bacterium]
MFSVNYRDSRPIYEQVKDSIRLAIITGAMKADDKVPSVRDLAGQLAINPNTIQKAYRELESEGYIYSVPGKGSFVGECREALESRKKELFIQLDSAVSELNHLGVSEDDICSYIMKKTAWEEK